MDAIKSIGMSICITLVITSIFSMLMPDTKLDKVIKFAISLFFLTSLISPFFTSNVKISVDISDIVLESKTTDLERATENQFFLLAQKNVANVLERYLRNQDIPVIKIEVSINKLSDNNISINKLVVYINQEQKDSAVRIESLLKREVGVAPSIVVVNQIQTKETEKNEVVKDEIQ